MVQFCPICQVKVTERNRKKHIKMHEIQNMQALQERIRQERDWNQVNSFSSVLSLKCTRAETISGDEQTYMCSNQSNDVDNLSVENNCDPADFEEGEKSPAINAENNHMDTENSNVSSDNVETHEESVEERDDSLSLFSCLGAFKNTVESPLSFESVTNGKLFGTLNDTEQSNYKLILPYKCDKIMSDTLNKNSTTKYDMCINGCKMYYPGDASIACCFCNEERYEGILPRKTTYQLSIGRQLADFLANSANVSKIVEYKKTIIEDSLTVKEPVYKNVFNGSVFGEVRGMKELSLVLHIDGFNLFKRGGISITIIMVTILDLTPTERYKQENIFIISIISGPKKPKNLFSYLYPVLQDFLVFESQGLQMNFEDDLTSLYRASIAFVIGDIVGIAELCMHSGHSSYYNCRVCKIRGDQQQKNQRGIYFSNMATSNNRSRQSFIEVDTEYEIKKPTPFGILSSFTGTCFFGLDKLYLWGQNIGKHLWAIVTDNGQKKSDISNPLFLRKPYRVTLALSNHHSKNRSFLNMATSAGYGRAIDYIDFLMFVVFTLLVEALELQTEDLKINLKNEKKRKGKGKAAKATILNQSNEVDPEEQSIGTGIETAISCMDRTAEALASLSLVCQLSEKLYISTEDVSAIEHHVNIWHAFLRDLVEEKCFTINQHYLLHLSKYRTEMGPLKEYSACALERTIGLCKENIKSRSKPGENAINFMCNNFASAKQKWHYELNERDETHEADCTNISSDKLDMMLDAENIPFDEMLLNFCVCENIPFNSKVPIVNRVEYTVAGNHQTVKKIRGRDGIDIISKEITLDMSLKLFIINI
ncbi:hypothetical protein PHYBLDRAFT_170266 [Phycomyces blakesleeanus NRRL 1555(-)]|uniref:C2H2-type zinc finger transcription factor n=1 Tax=Phycomyces blakesleeanus (strain ATCC 8743b / DSM 1359 / FGSC 10004 / NBRC 33097 / NRRL 1555) TaxID=763407 RepID=A0A162WYP4_PHYB8|nr:hypothetical protein PHYBLDRAFT_170266 [Phycomyces blakesleeanus NRRL 1555(-)]OAD71605.1 hypothetical protein PHYBLDRAFT_170266 [Phycomyces blakesleeanus NRRL 1555(-)]|eukprot:XP_018289645.1 hypothetical protein PHYBLDRAFT_170266 [Phycomyces blakesleeanus NRRL 1555(-)]